MSGWIKLHRSLLQWEWYDDINVKVTFIHLLLSANHAPRKWRGIDIGRGQLWTSIGNLSKEVGISEKQIRNCLKKLESTSEIVIQGASNGTMITVCKYDSYQAKEETEGEQMGERRANDGQTMGKQWATNKNDNNYKNDKNVSVPTREEVEKEICTILFSRGIASVSFPVQDLAQRFHDNYESKGWEINGQRIYKWQPKLNQWISEELKNKSSSLETQEEKEAREFMEMVNAYNTHKTLYGEDSANAKFNFDVQPNNNNHRIA